MFCRSLCVHLFVFFWSLFEQTTQWPKGKVQMDTQRSTKHTHKTKDRVTRTPLKTGVELRCSGKVGSSCSTSGARRVNLVTNPVISHEWGKDRIMIMSNETYPWSFVEQIFHNVNKGVCPSLCSYVRLTWTKYSNPLWS